MATKNVAQHAVKKEKKQSTPPDAGSPAFDAARKAFQAKKEVSLKQEASNDSAKIHSLLHSALQNARKGEGRDAFKEDIFSGYPTDMTRCNPFFPVNPNAGMSSRPDYLERYVIRSGKWGAVTFTGPRLTVYDEDVLVAILALLYDKNNSPLFNLVKDTETEEQTLTYKGPAAKILRGMGYARPSGSDYERLFKTLDRFTVSALRLEVSTGTAIQGASRAPRISTMASIISRSSIDEATKNVIITINPFFYKTFLEGTVTMLNAGTRIKLRSPIAKVLYRFVMSQKREIAYSGSFQPLAEALNMDMTQPAFKTRQNLRKAIATLIEKNILSPRSGFTSPEMIFLEKRRQRLDTDKFSRIDMEASGQTCEKPRKLRSTARNHGNSHS